MKSKIYLLLLTFYAMGLYAQESRHVNLSVEARADYQRESIDGVKNNDKTGF